MPQVEVRVVEQKGKCAHCGKSMKLCWIVGSVTYAQECFKLIFTERSNLTQIAGLSGKTNWVLLDDRQPIRLVLYKKPKTFVGIVGRPGQDGKEHEAWGQKEFKTEREARIFMAECLDRFMKRYDFNKITLKSANYKDMFI